jgi:hypothetical protein
MDTLIVSTLATSDALPLAALPFTRAGALLVLPEISSPLMRDASCSNVGYKKTLDDDGKKGNGAKKSSDSGSVTALQVEVTFNIASFCSSLT